MLFITKWKIPKEQCVLVFLICCFPSFEKFVRKVFKYKIMDFQFNSIENLVILSVNIYLAHDAKNGFFNEKNGKIIKEDEKTWYFIENCGDTESQKTRPLEYRTFNNNLLIKSNLQQQKSRPMALCRITSLRIRWQIFSYASTIPQLKFDVHIFERWEIRFEYPNRKLSVQNQFTDCY